MTKRERSEPTRWDVNGLRFRIGTRILATITSRRPYIKRSSYARAVWDRAYWMGCKK